jgi:3'(2'), 5'-bisphosphate nucleotidase
MGNRINFEVAIKAAIQAGEEIMTIYGDPNADFSVERKADNSPLTIADKKSHTIINQLLQTTKIPVLSEEGRSIPFQERKEWSIMWVVDPLDGTKEFIKRNGEFTVNIALVENGNPVAGVIYVPVTKTLYAGANGWGVFRLNDASAETTIQSLEKDGTPLPQQNVRQHYTIAGSRSHMNWKTKRYIHKLKKQYHEVNIVKSGSSLKICMVAEGSVDEYPRFGPTMEWDTAAGHAIANAAGKKLWLTDLSGELVYNKENLLNPYFIVK